MTSSLAIIALTASGSILGRRIQQLRPDGVLHGLAHRVVDADVGFDGFAEHLRALFTEGQALVVVAASGVVIRALASIVADKHDEPPVIAVSEDGKSVVPLLGGHRGANRLAQDLAQYLDGHAAVTTAGDIRFNIALDAPPQGLTLANPQHYRGFVARLLAGESVRPPDIAVDWLARSALPFANDAALSLVVTADAIAGTEDQLVYHSRTLCVGVGCERNTESSELLSLVQQTLGDNGLAVDAVAGVYSLDLKADECAVNELAKSLGVAARFFDAATLEKESPRLKTPSEVVFNEVGCHGVSEGAALAAAGPQGSLIVAKTKSARATCAIAQMAVPHATGPHGDEAHGLMPHFDGAYSDGQPGVQRGHLAVVGIGPGHRDSRTPEVSAALRTATDWVGYSLYLDLVGDLHTTQQRHDYNLGEEIDRVRAAIALAAAGRNVALVCSGDAGIYAMATLVFEVLDDAAPADWRRIAVQVLPGVTAGQVAAARSGAPMGHDFCAISLSDLLTPRPIIEQRVKAAAQGDFVIAFYNPVSRRRREPFELAVRILREHRTPDTPVVLARSLGRPDETVDVITLAELETDRVDMMTLVLVGASETRRLELGGNVYAYTPRGYASKGLGA
jgi:cobalt-precorrin 5A hydrolase/precorrin-3B C17-methyltransferase